MCRGKKPIVPGSLFRTQSTSGDEIIGAAALKLRTMTAEMCFVRNNESKRISPPPSSPAPWQDIL